MKICFIISSLLSLGGTERVAVSLANELSKKNEVVIISRNAGYPAYSLLNSVKDVRVLGNYLTFAKRLKSILLVESPDLVIVHTMSKLTPYLLLSGLKTKKLWSLEHISYQFHSVMFRLARKILYNKLDRVLVFTASQQQIFSQFCKKVDIIRNPSPLEITNLDYNKSSRKIISIGRLTHQKGYDLLIEAWKIIEKRNPSWSFFIYGDGELKNTLAKKIKFYRLSNIYLCGQERQIEKIYDSASFYVMSSRYEGLPMVLIEAQSRGLPIVSFLCPTGPEEIVSNNNTGYLVECGNIQALARAMESLILNPDIRERMSFCAKVNAEYFSTQSVVSLWEDLIDEARSK